MQPFILSDELEKGKIHRNSHDVTILASLTIHIFSSLSHSFQTYSISKVKGLLPSQMVNSPPFKLKSPLGINM